MDCRDGLDSDGRGRRANFRDNASASNRCIPSARSLAEGRFEFADLEQGSIAKNSGQALMLSAVLTWPWWHGQGVGGDRPNGWRRTGDLKLGGRCSAWGGAGLLRSYTALDRAGRRQQKRQGLEIGIN